MFVRQGTSGNYFESEIAARDFERQLDGQSSLICNKNVNSEWNWASNVTDENEKIKVTLELVLFVCFFNFYYY